MAAALPVLQSVGSFLMASAPQIAGATAAAATGALLAPDGPGQPKIAEQAVPDSRKREVDNERRLLAAYKDKGRVGSMFGRDKLG